MLDTLTSIHTVLNSIADGMVIHDDSGVIVYANDRACEILGLARAQIEGTTALDPQWKTYNVDGSPFMGEHHPVSIVLKTKQPKQGVLMEIRRPDETSRWIRIHANPLIEEESFKGVVVTFLDVTLEIAQSAYYSRQANYLDVILKTTPTIVFAIDKEGVFTYSSGSGLKAIGLEENQVVGLNALEIYAPYEDIVQKLQEALQGTEQNYESVVMNRNFQTYLNPYYNAQGQLSGIVGISYDITDRLKNKKTLLMQTRQAQIGEMLSIIAHQWRQPLSAISSNLILLRLDMEMQTFSADTGVAMIEQTEKLVVHLSQTIDNFRDYFKPDKQKEPVTVVKLIELSLSLLEGSLRAHNVAIIIEDRTDGMVFESYKHELVQVLINLFNNVLDVVREKHLPQATITVTAFNVEYLYIEVSDDVGGIKETDLPEVFEPYFSTKDAMHGTGLGLYMCKSIIEEHCKGKLSVHNIEGGACFSIALPVGL